MTVEEKQWKVQYSGGGVAELIPGACIWFVYLR